jgi:D-lactate dehydrogenase
VLTKPRAINCYVTGHRSGIGAAVAVIRPGTLVELWRDLQACVAHHGVMVLQAANTELTGGSTPRTDGFDRPAVVMNTSRLGGGTPP